MQIIIIDSAEALAEDIRKEYIKNPLVNVKQAVLSCLHPIEVPNDAGEIAEPRGGAFFYCFLHIWDTIMVFTRVFLYAIV